MTILMHPSLMYHILKVLNGCSKTLWIHIFQADQTNSLTFTTFNNSTVRIFTPFIQFKVTAPVDELAIPEWINHCLCIKDLLAMTSWYTQNKKEASLVAIDLQTNGTITFTHHGKSGSMSKFFNALKPEDPLCMAPVNIGEPLLDKSLIQMSFQLKDYEGQPFYAPALPAGNSMLQVTYEKDYLFLDSTQRNIIYGKTLLDKGVLPIKLSIDQKCLEAIKITFDKTQKDCSSIMHYKTANGLFCDTSRIETDGSCLVGISYIVLHFPDWLYKEIKEE